MTDRRGHAGAAGAAAAPPPRRRTTRWPATPTCSPHPALADAVAARLPHRQHRRGAAGRAIGRRAALPGRGLQDQLAGRLRRRAADRSATTRPPRLAEAMMDAHYPLQALLYAVAVHRMLRWRQPGYDPEPHLGGVLYLFVRGMAGPDTPRVDGVPCGVFSWRPPAALVTELSDLLDGGRRDRDAEPTTLARHERRDRWPHGAPGLLGGVQRGRRARAGRRAHREAVGRIGREPDERVLLALALTVRALRNGLGLHRPATGATPPSSTRRRQSVDVAGLPWPEPDALAGGLRGQPAGRRRAPTRPAAGRCGWPTACSTSSATGSRRSRSASQLQRRFDRRAARGRRRRGWRPAWTGCSRRPAWPPASPTGSGSPQRSARSAG